MSHAAPSGPDPRRGVDGVSRILAVASGKGGVGKSTVAVNLALALQARGRRVAILDADVYGPNVALLLGVRRRANADVNQAMVDLASIEPHRQRPMPLVRHGLSVLSLAFLVGEEQAILPDNAPLAGLLIRQLLFDTIWGEQDYLILDLPPGTGEPQATLVTQVAIAGVVLVFTPQSTAILDTIRSYHMFRDADVPILGRIENMSYLRCPRCGEQIDLPRSEAFAGSALTEVPLLGRLPFDPLVGEATNSGRPIVLTDKDAEVSRAFMQIAERVETHFDVSPT
jgi:ATP-binding protein involved in chromosome partitioning